jgi:methionine synthase I (cobalamin-dependent)
MLADRMSLEKGRNEMIKIFEGAIGTTLQRLGLADKPCPEYASVTAAEAVTEIHRSYAAAGADMLECNTFGPIL